MKKIISLCVLAATLVIALFPGINLTFAQQPITFIVEPENYYAQKKGEIFTVYITINNVNAEDRLVGIEFRLGYNSTLLEVTNVEEGPFFRQFNQTSTPPYTFFIYYIETGIWGPHVLVGAMIFPNSTGDWPGPMPEGNGIIAKITFKAIYQPIEPSSPANCTLNLFNSTAVNDSKEHLPVEEIDGYYEIVPALYPIAKYEYTPQMPTAGQEVIFNASASYDPDGSILWYYWEFEDGIKINTTETTLSHVFNASGWHDVKLTIKDIDNLTSTIMKTVEVGAPAPINIAIESGDLHFRGEICEYNILITHLGRAVNADELSATLYFRGNIIENFLLPENISKIRIGFYTINYTISGTAEAGTYTLLVEAKYNGMCGMNMHSFYVSDNLAGMKSTIDSIHDDIINTVIPDLGLIKLNLTEIHAVVTSINGTTATISTDIGDLTTNVNDLSDSILGLDNKVDNVKETQGTILTTLYAILILAIIAIVAAATAAYFARKAKK